MIDGVISIDFDIANTVSNDMSSLETNINSIKRSSLSAADSLKGVCFASTRSRCAQIEETINNASKELTNSHTYFDQAIEGYYQLENEGSNSGPSDIPNLDYSKVGDYRWKAAANSKMQIINKEELVDYLTKNGWTYDGTRLIKGDYTVIPIGGNGDNYYRIEYNGSDYNSKVCCYLYKTPTTSLTKINGSVTFFGPSNDNTGAKKYLDGKVPLSDGTIFIAPVQGNLGNPNTPPSSQQALTATRFADNAFNIKPTDNHVCAGFSQGSIVATRTVCDNPGTYNKLVMINGSTNTMNNPNKNWVTNYDALKKTEVVYVESNAGWGLGNPGVKNSINDLVKNGVDPSKITLITNDQGLANNVSSTGIKVDTSMPSKYNGHGSAFNMMADSNIIADVTNI